MRLDSLRTSTRNEGVKLSRRQTIVTDWTSCTWCRSWWNHSWHSRLKSALFCIHSSAHSSDIKISYHFANSELQRCFLVAPQRDRLSGTHPAAVNHLTVGQLLYSSDCMGTGRTVQRDAKANFWFGNTARKQWTLSGFLQHTSANTIYIENNKNDQQLKVLHMNIKCFKVSHNSQANFCTRTQLLS